MVKVAHYISTSGLYGAERWILGLLNHIKGVDTLLICTNFDNQSLIKEADKLGIKTRLLEVKGNYAVLDHIKKLKKLIKKEKIDILHTHGYKADMIGLFAARRSGIKIISTPHGWSIEAGAKLRCYEAVDRFLLMFFDLVVPHTTLLNKSLRHVNKKIIVRNFIDLESIPKPEKRNIKLIIYIGQLIHRKRVNDLIMAMKYLPKEIKLHILGDGRRRKELIDIVKRLGLENRIHFLGFRKDRLELLNKSGILVLPSLVEWIPRVAMEAMAMERVVIATDIEGNRELIKDKETGLLVPTNSPKKIAEAVKYIINNENEAEKIIKNAKRLIEKEFSAEKAAEEFERVYLKLC